MNQLEAKKQIEKFLGKEALTFSVTEYPDNKWVAQCNEIDGIITCGIGYDLAEMEALMQDAILTAAGIPKEFSKDLLKRVYTSSSILNAIETDSSSPLFQSAYTLQNEHARMG